MNKWHKIAGILVGAIIILFLVVYCLLMFCPQLFWSYKPDDEFDKRIRNEIVRRIENYIEQNNRLPESLSEIGFEQLPGLYKYRGHSVCLIKCADLDYVLECWDDVAKLWQYGSENKKWYDYAYWKFEPPINIDTIRGINKAYYSPKENMQSIFDSLRINDNVTSILDYDGEVTPDSIAYIRYYTADTLNMEGWVTYRANSRPHYVKEFGEWKYYDGKGNCYRKFWNYKQNGKLIYETDL
ncbi:MAG: hypothetical protein K2I18_06295 [Paramuribaculum sp.]|nr:hypothetical protein [Paramuribaculum sp.]